MQGKDIPKWPTHYSPDFRGSCFFPSNDEDDHDDVEDPCKDGVECEETFVAAGALAEDGEFRGLGLDLGGEFCKDPFKRVRGVVFALLWGVSVFLSVLISGR